MLVIVAAELGLPGMAGADRPAGRGDPSCAWMVVSFPGPNAGRSGEWRAGRVRERGADLEGMACPAGAAATEAHRNPKSGVWPAGVIVPAGRSFRYEVVTDLTRQIHLESRGVLLRLISQDGNDRQVYERDARAGSADGCRGPSRAPA